MEYFGHIAGLLWLTPTRCEYSPMSRFTTLFRLTAAEARLVSRLISGDSTGNAAAHLNISVHTVRNQLKSVFQKTGQRTQAQLLSLVHKIEAVGYGEPLAAPLGGLSRSRPRTITVRSTGGPRIA